MRSFLARHVRQEILENLTDAEKKELGHMHYLSGVLAAVVMMANFGLLMAFWPVYGGIGLLVGAEMCFIAAMVPIGLGIRSGYESWLRGTAYAKSLSIRSPGLR